MYALVALGGVPFPDFVDQVTFCGPGLARFMHRLP